MNRPATIIAIIVFLLSFTSCSNENGADNEASPKEIIATADSTIQILYFHGYRRCPECLAIEKISKEVNDSLSKSNRSLRFYSINIDKDKYRTIAERFQVTWSSLVINLWGKPDNITYEAFKYALDEPDSLRTLIKRTINRK